MNSCIFPVLHCSDLLYGLTVRARRAYNVLTPHSNSDSLIFREVPPNASRRAFPQHPAHLASEGLTHLAVLVYAQLLYGNLCQMVSDDLETELSV